MHQSLQHLLLWREYLNKHPITEHQLELQINQSWANLQVQKPTLITMLLSKLQLLDRAICIQSTGTRLYKNAIALHFT